MAKFKIENTIPNEIEAYLKRTKAAGQSSGTELPLTLSEELIQRREALLQNLDRFRLGLPPARTDAPNSTETLEAIRQAMAGQRE